MILFRAKNFREYTNVQNFPYINQLRLYDLKFVRSFRNSFIKGNKYACLYKVYKQCKFKKFFNLRFSSTRIISKALVKLCPLVFFKPKKVAGILHRIPVIQFGCGRERFQAVKWLYEGAKISRKRKYTYSFIYKVIGELFDVLRDKRTSSSLYKFRSYHKLVTASLPLTRFLQRKPK